MRKIPMTPEGADQLRHELERLKQVERPRIITAITEARAHGDLKENAEYHAAREQQGFIEARIRDVEAKLSHIQIIDIRQITNDGKVIFGATIKLANVKTEETFVYRIVGEEEANIKERKISVTSPIARAIIGKYIGDTAEVETPGGKVEYEILEVEYA